MFSIIINVTLSAFLNQFIISEVRVCESVCGAICDYSVVI